jgi:hypothetical protein
MRINSAFDRRRICARPILEAAVRSEADGGMTESVFAAAVLSLHIFQTAGTPPGPAAHLEIAAQPPVVNHSVSVQRVRDWLSSGGKTPKEQALKSRLRELP